MSEAKKSQQLGQYIKRESTTLGAKATPATKIIYTRLDGDYANKETYVTYFTGTLDEASTSVLKSLKEGDKFVINKKSAPNAKDPTRPFWNLESFAAADTFIEKPAYTPRGNFSNTPKKEYDQTGVKVGASRNQAIAFLAATKGTKFTLDDVDVLAYEIVQRQSVMEDNVRAGIYRDNKSSIEQRNQDQYAELDGDVEPIPADEIPF